MLQRLFLATAGLAFAAPAFADPAAVSTVPVDPMAPIEHTSFLGEKVITNINIGGINLTTRHGQLVLAERMYRSMISICGTAPPHYNLRRDRQYNACLDAIQISVADGYTETAYTAFSQAKFWMKHA